MIYEDDDGDGAAGALPIKIAVNSDAKEIDFSFHIAYMRKAYLNLKCVVGH